jgi:biopolymer transport protein ExbD
MQLFKPPPLANRLRILPLVGVMTLLVVLVSPALFCMRPSDDTAARLPLGQLARPPAAASRATVRLHLKTDGRLLLDGVSISRAQLEPILRRRRASLGDAVAILTADPAAATGSVQELMEACHAAGWDNVVLGN